MKALRRWIVLMAVVVLVAGCRPATPAPYWPTDGWRSSTPEAQGMDSEMLAQMFEAIGEQDDDVDSVTVIRNGYLVADAAIYPFQPGSRHVIHSCTKSIVSALIGIAIDEGYIAGVDQPLLDFFPDRTVAHLDVDKEAMTLEHVLTMATGWACRDSYLYRWRGLREMERSQDWVQFMLDLPMAEEPGTRFEYCNGASFVLSAIIQEATGVSALAFAQAHLFGPLGISDVVWPSNPQGINVGWGEMCMRPHDMAKIGYLYLNEGRWDGEQIVPAGWVAASTRKHISGTLQDGYGYQWWVRDDGVYMALGYAGQFIVVVPEKDLVVVFTSELAEEDFYRPQTLLDHFIIPAARSPAPLPANPDGVARLAASIQTLAGPR
jgi:CubicO group peptidase (beta-lactamase class C family)